MLKCQAEIRDSMGFYGILGDDGIQKTCSKDSLFDL